MLRTLMISVAALGVIACTPPAAQAPAPPKPMEDAPQATPPAASWQTAAGPDDIRITIAEDGSELTVVCRGLKKQIQIDLRIDGVKPTVPDGAKLALQFGDDAKFEAPATASAATGFVWSATYPASADLVTGFMLGAPVKAIVSWKIGEGFSTENSFGVGSDAASTQFGTDCAQITGLKGG